MKLVDQLAAHLSKWEEPGGTKKYAIFEGPRFLLLDRPERLAQPGDVYKLVRPCMETIAPAQYFEGDTFEIIERTQETRSVTSTLGNLRIKCKQFTSVWACFEELIAHGDVVLVSPAYKNADDGVYGPEYQGQ